VDIQSNKKTGTHLNKLQNWTVDIQSNKKTGTHLNKLPTWTVEQRVTILHAYATAVCATICHAEPW